MTEQHSSSVIRRCDVAVVGGSAAGLAAALQVQRQDRSTIVIDSGEPRNAPAANMHGYLGYDGAAPSELTATGRAEVRRYGGEILTGSVRTVDHDPGEGFRLYTDGVIVHARRVVAATGVTDELPKIEGIAAHWGKSVIHCPFCHGYEVRGQRLVHLVTHPIGLHPARLFAHLSNDLTLVIPTDVDVDVGELATLEAAGATIHRGEARRLVEGPGAQLDGVELADGSFLAADAVVVTTRLQPRIEPFHELGLTAEPHASGVADYVAADPMGETAVEGLYAAGNLTDPSHQVLAAAASGSFVGAAVAFSLAAEDQATADFQSSAEAEWDARYSNDQVWSGEPNGTLVTEVAPITPGRALDIGAGEGGDAIWLADNGWDVTATDIATTGLRRLASTASERDIGVRCVTVNANANRAFGEDTFDLVSLFYPAIARTGDDRAIANIMRAVAPGGTLLVVGHAPHDTHTDDGHTAPWDSASYVGIDHIEAAIQSTPDWTVVRNEIRDRPEGSSTHSHHDKDIVFRAHRDTP